MAAVSSLEALSVVVPTLGTSPLLRDCLEALRTDTEGRSRILLVDQGSAAVNLPEGSVDEVLTPGRNLGFAGGMNLGFTRCRTEFVAAVNDDFLVEPGWSRTLLEALEARPEAAAAQGINLQLDAPRRVDGAGIAFNGWWQAIQRNRGELAPSREIEAAPEEIFGVSATAAIYRREALAAVALQGKEGESPAPQATGFEVFDESFESYYEDVDLACRLRRAGFSSLLVPEARGRHAGSISGESLGLKRLELIYGNRYGALARFLGASFEEIRPRVAQRDLRDLLAALLALQPRAGPGNLPGNSSGQKTPSEGTFTGKKAKRLWRASAASRRRALPGGLMTPAPELSGIVVHWRNEEQLEALVGAWPRDPRFELLVVDNSRSLGPLPDWVRRIEPERNRGFAGGGQSGSFRGPGGGALPPQPGHRSRAGSPRSDPRRPREATGGGGLGAAALGSGERGGGRRWDRPASPIPVAAAPPADPMDAAPPNAAHSGRARPRDGTRRRPDHPPAGGGGPGDSAPGL